MEGANPALQVMGLATAYWASRCLHVVAELGVADLLGEEPQTAEALAGRLEVQPQALWRLLRALANHGVFEVRGDRIAHNAASRLLVSGAPGSMRSFARMMGMKAHWAAYGELDFSVRTGKPSVAEVTPGGFFAFLTDNPEEGRVFDEAMTGKSSGQIRAALAAYDFTRFGTIGDIGGGAGHLLHAVLDAAPAAQGVLFDLPAVADRAAAAPHPRATYVGGDFFADPIPACDAYLLMTVLHDWSDEESAAILNAIRKGAPEGAKLLVLENVLGAAEGYDFAADLDIEMMVMTTGRERTEADWRSVLSAGGFRLARIIQTGAGAIIEGEVA